MSYLSASYAAQSKPGQIQSKFLVLATIILAATVAVLAAISPQPAFAALASGNTNADAQSSSLQASAAKKAIWVVTKVKSVRSAWPDEPTTKTYGYAKNGLVTKESSKSSGVYLKHVYDKKGRFLRTKSTWEGTTDTTKYTLDKKGRVISIGSGNSVKYNSKGYCSKYTFARGKMYRTYTFDKKGRLASAKGWGGQGFETIKSIKYDSKNQITSYKNTEELKSKKAFEVANTYKNGRLVKQVKTRLDPSDTETFTYSYKKVYVPKSLVAKVKAQQKRIFFGSVIESTILPSITIMNK